MCDTLAVLGSGRLLFAKNSDRPPDEPQVVEVAGARAAGTSVRTQYLEVDDLGARPVLGSRPTWLWGFEHGVNADRVAIGNEKVWTSEDPHPVPDALIGMDLVRLGLERADTAEKAVDVITELLQRHGQGGSGEADHHEPYWSSFLIGDPRSAWVLETSGRSWVARPAGPGAAISNRISVGTDWARASADVAVGEDFDRRRDPSVPVGIAEHRLDATRACVTTGAALSARDVVATLRHHGDGPWGAPGADPAHVSPPPTGVGEDWSGVTVCMHVRGYQATTASMVAELPADPAAPARAWLALGSPCVSAYVPVFPDVAGSVPDRLRLQSTWTRFAILRDGLERAADPEERLRAIRAVLGPMEAEQWDEADDLATSLEPHRVASFAERAELELDGALTRLGV